MDQTLPKNGNGKGVARLDPQTAVLVHGGFPAIIAALALVVAKYANDVLMSGQPFSAASYLTFHNLIELSSIILSGAIFFVGFYSYSKNRNFRVLVVSCAFLFVAIMDTFHALSFLGMPGFFSSNDVDKAIDYWLPARMVQALVTSMGWTIPEKIAYRRPQTVLLALVAAAVGALFIVITYFHGILPVYFVPGTGLTTAKIVAEYAVMVIALLGMAALLTRPAVLRRRNERFILTGLVFFIAGEFAFTAYKNAYDVYNLLGHLFKSASMLFLFGAVFSDSISEPYDELERAENDIRKANDELEQRVAQRTAELQQADEALIREKEKLATMLSNVGDGVIAIDKEWNIILWNRAATHITGWKEREAIGRPFRNTVKFVRASDKEECVVDIADTMLDGRIRDMGDGTLIMTRDGRELPVWHSVAPITDPDGMIIGVIVAFRDVSSDKEIERAKHDLVSIVTHELRGPAARIKGYIDLYFSRWGKSLDQEQTDYLKKIDQANDRSIELADSLLSVFRVDFGAIVIMPEPLDLTEISDATVKEHEAAINAKNLTVSRDYDARLPIMQLDRKLTKAVFDNLLSNAIKYTPQGGRIAVTVKKQDGNVQIGVADTGMGIPKEDQPQIFGKFFRAANVRSIDGVGAGLHVLREMLTRAGCRIWFNSEEGKGTTFTVSIPENGMYWIGH